MRARRAPRSGFGAVETDEPPVQGLRELRVRRRLANAALALASMLVALLLCEFALRLSGDALTLHQERFSFRWMVYDPVLSWRNVPGSWTKKYYAEGVVRSEHLRINAHGFRGDEITTPKPAAATRIVCLGDSVTFGIINNPRPGRSDARMIPIASYPGELRRGLERDAPGRFEVINAGVIGYSSSHGLRQLVTELLELEPDILTVRFGVNDSQPSWAPWHRSHEPSNRLLRELLYGVHDWKLARLFLAAYRSLRFLHPEPESVRWTSAPRYRKNLERIIEVAEANGIRVLLLDYPLAPLASPAVEVDRRAQRRAVEQLEKVARAVAREQGVPFLETHTRLRSHASRAFDTADFIHLNHRGAERLAQLIAEELHALGWQGPTIPQRPESPRSSRIPRGSVTGVQPSASLRPRGRPFGLTASGLPTRSFSPSNSPLAFAADDPLPAHESVLPPASWTLSSVGAHRP